MLTKSTNLPQFSSMVIRTCSNFGKVLSMVAVVQCRFDTVVLVKLFQRVSTSI